MATRADEARLVEWVTAWLPDWLDMIVSDMDDEFLDIYDAPGRPRPCAISADERRETLRRLAIKLRALGA